MPWSISDVDSNKKGLSDKQKRAWVHIANSALKMCKRRGGSECDASAIRQANAVSGRISEAMSDDEAIAAIRESLRVGDSQDAARQAVIRALSVRYASTDLWAWVTYMFDDHVVYEIGGDYHQCTYEVGSDGEATLGEPEEVEMYFLTKDEANLPNGKESGMGSEVYLGSDVIDLLERAVKKDGTIPIKIIQPGQGSTGFYPAGVLKRDGPKVFKMGTQMFWDHPTVQEEGDRPEGSLRDLAGEFVEDARWEDQGAAGPGLYTRAKIFSPFREVIDEIGPNIGVSIRAKGVAKNGQVGGKATPILEELKSVKSVDFVTRAGAGGKVVEIFEAARSRRDDTSNRGGPDMDEKELQALREAAAERDRLQTEVQTLRTEGGRLREGLILRDAQAIVAEALNVDLYEGLSDKARKRVSGIVLTKVPEKDGKVDEPALREAVAKVAKEEVEYLSEASGAKIRGVGGQSPSSINLAESGKRLDANISRLTGTAKKEA
jgi:hypothetical protein